MQESFFAAYPYSVAYVAISKAANFDGVGRRMGPTRIMNRASLRGAPSALAPADQSRDVMRRGQGAALCLEWLLRFPGPRLVAVPWVESAVLRS